MYINIETSRGVLFSFGELRLLKHLSQSKTDSTLEYFRQKLGEAIEGEFDTVSNFIKKQIHTQKCEQKTQRLLI